jgi:hypothetical protein
MTMFFGRARRAGAAAVVPESLQRSDLVGTQPAAVGSGPADWPLAEVFHGLMTDMDAADPSSGDLASGDFSRGLAPVRSLLARRQKALRKRFIVDHARDGYHRDLAGLAEEAVLGLLDLGLRRHPAAARLQAVMGGGALARGMLAPGDALDLTFVSAPGADGSVEALAAFVRDGLSALDLRATTRAAGDLPAGDLPAGDLPAGDLTAGRVLWSAGAATSRTATSGVPAS